MRASGRAPYFLGLAPRLRVADPVLGRATRFPFVAPDRALGYRLVPGTYELRVGPRTTRVDISEQGLRGERVFAPAPAPGTLRVAFVGCSFTFGHGVEEPQTFVSRLAERNPHVEALNLGVPGYGQDQCLLRLREDGPWATAQLVVCALVPFTDMRNIADVSPFPAVAFRKPRFTWEDGALVLHELSEELGFDPRGFDVHGRELRGLDRLRPYSRIAEALLRPDEDEIRAHYGDLMELTARIVIAIRDLARERGSRFIVLFMPARAMLETLGAEAAADYVPVRRLREEKVRVLDPSAELAARLAERGTDAMFADDGQHPSELYHEVVAALLHRTLDLQTP